MWLDIICELAIENSIVKILNLQNNSVLQYTLYKERIQSYIAIFGCIWDQHSNRDVRIVKIIQY